MIGGTPCAKLFSFEHTWMMTEEDFLRMNDPRFVHSRRALAKLAIAAALGVAMLFTRYTVGFGLVAIAVAILMLMMPDLAENQMRRSYARTLFLRHPVTYGVSRRGFWLRGAHLAAECDWTALVVWREHAGYLRLSGSGMPPVFLPIARMREEGIYDDVLALAIGHAPEYDSPRSHAA